MIEYVQFFKIVGGKHDGSFEKLREPMSVEHGSLKEIWCGDECYHVDRVEDGVAILVAQ